MLAMGLDNLIPFLIVGVIFLLVAVGGAVNVLGDRKRRAAVAEVAEQLGLSYADDGAGLLAELSSLPLFSRGRSKQISNVIQGDTDEVGMGIFDYRYTTGSGKNSQTYRQTVVFFRSPGMNLPQFELKPQSFFHGIGKLLGYQDIDFQSHRKFSKAFVLRGTSETAVRQLFTADLLSFCETKPQVSVEGQGHDLVFYRPSKRVKPDQLRDIMSEGFEVFKHFQTAAAT
jgi:hypothetical protein